jgi:DNA-binding IclR family transcriptional regulator
MSRPKGESPTKIASILGILAKYPEGVWIRKLAREANMHPTTATKYVEGSLKAMIEVSSLGEKPLLKVVRLKPSVFQRLEEGMSLSQIMRVFSAIQQASKQ